MTARPCGSRDGRRRADPHRRDRAAAGREGTLPELRTGRLFRAYLKVRPQCEVCAHDLAQYPCDDAPPYFTILIVGHLFVGPLLAFPIIRSWPPWLLLGLLMPMLTAAALVRLPIVKGSVVGVLWAVGKPPAA